MTKNEIIETIKDILIEIIPELEDEKIDFNETFTGLGANSVDRGELITLTLERLDLNIPRIDFVEAQTINDLSDLVFEKQG
jgi:polyketide biosynthesis acyl carrier protein